MSPHELDLVVVDDDEMILEIVERIVSKTMASFRLFRDADQAMSHLSQARPSPRVLVIDYYMPTITGIEFLIRLKSHNTLEESSVFLCSAGEPRHAQIEQLQQLGVEVIDKSVMFDSKALLALVECPQSSVTGNRRQEYQ